jgi:hypothetical protein
MNRLAILPCGGDPFCVLTPLYYYKTVWGKEVDKLIVVVNSPVEKECIDFIRELVAKVPNAEMMYFPIRIQQGNAIRAAFDASKEEYLLFTEDDSFIYRPGYVDKYFKELESGQYDAVGDLREFAHPKLIETTMKVCGSDSRMVNLHPCFFFGKRSDFLKTDLNFSSREFKEGEYIAPLDWTVDIPYTGNDQFVWMSIQLRTLAKVRIHELPIYMTSIDDQSHAWGRMGIFDKNCPLVHFGSSACIEDILTDSRGIPLARRKEWTEAPPEHPYWNIIRNDKIFVDMVASVKLAWIKWQMTSFWPALWPLRDWRDEYKTGFERLTQGNNVNHSIMDSCYDTYCREFPVDLGAL